MNQEVLSLRKDAAEVQAILLKGAMNRYGELWSAIPREVVSGSLGIESVIFEVIRPEGLKKPPLSEIVLKAIRLESLTLTLMPSLAVLLMGLFHKWDGSWVLGVTSFLGVLFFQIAVTLLNDVEDHLRLIDLPGGGRGNSVIQKGWISALDLKKVGYFAFALGILFGIPAVYQSPMVLMWIGGAGALGVLTYSSQPLGLKYREFGDLPLFLLSGPLLALGLSQAVFGRVDFSILFIGFYFGFAAWGVAHSSNIQDIESDWSRQIQTLATRLKFKAARHWLVALYALSWSSIYLGLILGFFPLYVGFAIFLTAIWIIPFLRRVYRASGPVSALLSPIRSESMKLHFILGLSLCLGILVSLIAI